MDRGPRPGIEIVDRAAERSRRGEGPAAEAWLDEDTEGPVTTGGVPPSWSDRLVRATSHRLGGPLGRRADTVGSWWNAARWVLLTATVVYLLGVLFRLPCRVTEAGQSPDSFRWMCYSDIGILYQLRGLMQGNVPYLDSGSYPVLEYPVLTGWFLQLERVISTALGAPIGSELTAQQQVDSTLIFTDVNIVILGALLLVTVWAQVGSVPHRPWDAMMLAASPCVAATALINWDLLPVALTALGVLFWARRRPGWAGLFWGLGMAAKLYPLFLLGPLLLLCLRAGRMREFGRMLAAFAVAWLVMNLPALWLAPDNWLSFWTFNSDRSGDLGSIWYVLSLAGHPVDGLNSLALAVFGLMCVGIAALILVAPRRPRIGQVMFLVIVAFLLTNKVYSPQYVLWLLPFVVLARPVWRDWLIFTAGELAYFGAIWWHLGGLLAPGADGPDKVYWLAVMVRMLAQLWIVAVVVRDLWRPAHDVVRHPPGVSATFDDPTGGVLDGAPDVDWLPLRRPVRQLPSTDASSGASEPEVRDSPSVDGHHPPPAPQHSRRPLVTAVRVAATSSPAGSANRRTVAQAWLASRGLIALVALLLAVYQGRTLSDMVDQWDVEHFTNLATNGYLGRADGTLMAFFPGLPALLRVGLELGLPIYLTGVIISAIGSYLAATALARLGGPVAAVAWLFAPTAVFTVVPYTEALFCAAAFWAWERARADKWAAAATLAAVACTVRVSGLFLLGALAVLAITLATRAPGGRAAWRERGRRLLWLLVPTAALGAFVLYLYSLTGSWTAWYHAQSTGWARAMTPPWDAFWNTVAATHANPDHPLWPPVFLAEIVAMAIGVVVVGWCLGRRLWAEASWVAIQVLAFSISYWFMSVNRAILLWFPLWLMIAQLVTWRPAHLATRTIHRIVVGLAFTGSVLVMMAWSWLYFTGNWAS